MGSIPTEVKRFFLYLVWLPDSFTRANAQWVIHGFISTLIYTSELILCFTILITELGWDNLEIRRQKLKSLNGLTPNYLSSKFIQRSDVITSYNLRDSENKLAIPLPRTNYYKNSFGYSGAVLWNSLPSAARQATSLNNFRRLLINSDTAFM